MFFYRNGNFVSNDFGTIVRNTFCITTISREAHRKAHRKVQATETSRDKMVLVGNKELIRIALFTEVTITNMETV